MKYFFTKMHGVGNDFVVFDSFTKPFAPTAKNIKYMSDRHFGIGCDQVLLLEPSKKDGIDVLYRVFNADGGEVMQCGNGARCAAVYLKEKKLVNKDIITAEVGTETLLLQFEDSGNIVVNMGVPEFEPDKIPINANYRKDIYELLIDGKKNKFSAVSVGNPHAVIFVDDLENTDVDLIGTKIQRSDFFPEGVNVGFVEIFNRQSLGLRVFERGAGETLGCGSGACAATIIAFQQGYVEEKIDVRLKGGSLNLRWEGEGTPVYMGGPANIVFEGEIKL